MAEVALTVGGRSYTIACRDGGEAHLRTLAAHVDRKAQEAAAAVGTMNEARQLLFAALLIADEFADAKASIPGVADDPHMVAALNTLAARVEAIAGALEESGTST